MQLQPRKNVSANSNQKLLKHNMNSHYLYNFRKIYHRKLNVKFKTSIQLSNQSVSWFKCKFCEFHLIGSYNLLPVKSGQSLARSHYLPDFSTTFKQSVLKSVIYIHFNYSLYHVVSTKINEIKPRQAIHLHSFRFCKSHQYQHYRIMQQ